MVELALPVIAVTSRDQTHVSLMANNVKKALFDMHEIMKDYRSHEAVALLLESLKAQLRSAEESKAELST